MDGETRQVIYEIMCMGDWNDEAKMNAVMFIVEVQFHSRLRDFVGSTGAKNVPEVVDAFDEYSRWFMNYPLPPLLATVWKSRTFAERLAKEKERDDFNKTWTRLLDAPIMYDERQN